MLLYWYDRIDYGNLIKSKRELAENFRLVRVQSIVKENMDKNGFIKDYDQFYKAIQIVHVGVR